MDSCDHVTRIRPSEKHSILRPQKWLCSVCGTTESVYACLSCSHVACGRFNGEHSLQHYKESKHPIAIEVNNKHVYCYKCDDYVLNDNPSGDIHQLRTALSAIATQSFQEVEPTARPLLRSFSIHEECSEANQLEDKIRTADACRRNFLLRKTFQGWRNFVEEAQSAVQGKKRRLSGHAGYPLTPSSSFKRPAIIPGVTGLRNLGNTCYINSIVQVLSHLSAFRSFFLKLKSETDLSPWSSSPTHRTVSRNSKAPLCGRTLTRRTTIELFQHLSEAESSDQKTMQSKAGEKDKAGRKKDAGLHGGCSTGDSETDCEVTVPVTLPVSQCQELHALFRVLWSGKWAQVSPHAFLHAVWNAMPAFKGYSQQDAQEFLCELLDKVQDELKADGYSIKSQNTDFNDIVSCLFQGELVSQVTCLRCDHVSRTVECFTDLSLEFPDRYQVSGPLWTKPKEPCSLTEMLAKFTEEEVLDGEIYACERCNASRRKVSKKPVMLTEAKKQLLISHLPRILRLHLKRFRWSGRYHREKICSHVDFDDTLSMLNYCEESVNAGNCQYRLSGVVVHHGLGFGCGHYTAFTWNPGADSWVLCNDSRMELCSMDKVSSAQAYILFYTNVDDTGSESPSTMSCGPS